MFLIKQFKELAKNTNEETIRNFVLVSSDEYYDKVYWYARSRYKTYPEDVAQETFFKFQNALSKGLEMHFQEDEDVLRYLITIARHLTIDEQGRAQRIIHVDQFWETGKKANPYSSIDLKQDLQTKLKQLNPKQRKLMELLTIGYSYAEIGEQMDMKPDAVKKAIYRCRKKLKSLPD